MSRGPAATTSYAHDADGALTGLTLPDGSHVAITLDASGRPESMTLSAGMLHLGYDNTTGLLNSAMMPNAVGTQGLALTYDGPLLTQQRYTGAAMADVDFAYDELLRVSAVSVAGEATAYSYDRDGLVTSAGAETLTRDPDSGVVTATTVGNVHQIYATSGLMELNLYSATWSGGGNFSESIDSRDGAGRILEKTETGGVRRGYRYDADGRVTEERRGGVVIASYVYDPQGNRTALHRYAPGTGVETESRIASYDARERLLDDGLAAYTYDAAGRRASKTNRAGDVTRYGYDELGHLTRVELPSGTIVQYTYDALGRRTGRTTDGAVDGPTDTAWVYGAGPAPLATLNGDGSMRALWVYSTRSWVPDQLVIPNGASPLVYAVVTDHRGSVRGIVGTRAGLEIFAPADYDAFGNLGTAAAVSTRLGYYGFAFAGGILDNDSGLVHLGARDYDPETGTWIEPDPIRFGGGDTNLYAYVGGDAVNAIDPAGLLPDGSPAWDRVADAQRPAIAACAAGDCTELELWGGSAIAAVVVGFSGHIVVAVAAAIRAPYLAAVARIGPIAAGALGPRAEEAARECVTLRNEARAAAWGPFNFVNLALNRLRYGDWTGASADALFKQKASWEEVAAGAARANQSINRFLGLE